MNNGRFIYGESCPHERDRIWITTNRTGERSQLRIGNGHQLKVREEPWSHILDESGKYKESLPNEISNKMQIFLTGPARLEV